MAFSESLAARTRDVVARERGTSEKKMFGGLCFLVNGKLLVGVFKDSLLVRLGPDGAKSALTRPHVREMDFSSRPMKGWVVVEPDGIDGDSQLKEWVRQAIEFVVTIL